MSACVLSEGSRQYSPDDTSNHDRILAAKTIRNETRNQSTKPRTSGHGSRDTTLMQGAQTPTGLVGVFIEVTEVSLRADDGRHGRDIETEQAASNDGDGCDDIDVPDGHDGGQYPVWREGERKGV